MRLHCHLNRRAHNGPENTLLLSLERAEIWQRTCWLSRLDAYLTLTAQLVQGLYRLSFTACAMICSCTSAARLPKGGTRVPNSLTAGLSGCASVGSAGVLLRISVLFRQPAPGDLRVSFEAFLLLYCSPDT